MNSGDVGVVFLLNVNNTLLDNVLIERDLTLPRSGSGTGQLQSVWEHL